jgi:hypothetical protein
VLSGDGTTYVLSGFNLQIINGAGDTSIPNGLGNLIIGYNDLRGSGDNRTGSHNLIVGDQQNFSSTAGILGGSFNEIDSPYESITGGTGNMASGFWASIAGGVGNLVAADYSAIAGGTGNQTVIGSLYSSVLGGNSNVASAEYASVLGGQFNQAQGQGSSVTGGTFNLAVGDNSSVGGGSAVVQINPLGWSAGSMGTTNYIMGNFSSP